MAKLSFVKLLRLKRASGKRVPLPGPTHPLGGPLRTCHFGPAREAMLHLVTVHRRGQQMPSGSKVLGNGSIRGQKARGMPRGLKSLHAPLALPRRPMRILTPVVQVTTLAMLYPGQDLPFGRAVALQLIRDDDAWDVLQPLKQLAEKRFCRKFCSGGHERAVAPRVIAS